MVEHASHTFYEDSARVYGRAVTWFALIWAAIGVFMFFAPLRWHGTSVALSITRASRSWRSRSPYFGSAAASRGSR